MALLLVLPQTLLLKFIGHLTCHLHFFSGVAGLYPVSKPSIEHLLAKSGVGNAVVIIVGGAEESLSSSPGVNTVVMRKRKGFVKLALEYG